MFFLPPPLLHSPTVPTPPESTSTLCSHLTQPIRSAAPNAPLLLALHSVLHTSSHVIACVSLSFPISSIYASQSRHSTSFCPTPASFSPSSSSYSTLRYPLYFSPVHWTPPHATLVHSTPHCAHWVLSLPFSTINHHIPTKCLLILTLSTQLHYMPCIFGSLTLLEHFLNVVTSWPFFLPSPIPTDSPNSLES